MESSSRAHSKVWLVATALSNARECRWMRWSSNHCAATRDSIMSQHTCCPSCLTALVSATWMCSVGCSMCGSARLLVPFVWSRKGALWWYIVSHHTRPRNDYATACYVLTNCPAATSNCRLQSSQRARRRPSSAGTTSTVPLTGCWWAWRRRMRKPATA